MDYGTDGVGCRSGERNYEQWNFFPEVCCRTADECKGITFQREYS